MASARQGHRRVRGGGKGLHFSCQQNMLEVAWLWISALDLRDSGYQHWPDPPVWTRNETPNKLWTVAGEALQRCWGLKAGKAVAEAQLGQGCS